MKAVFCASFAVFSSIHVSKGLFFDNRELEIKENYDSYTRLSEKVSC